MGYLRGQRGVVLRGQSAFLLLFVVVENGKHRLDMQGYVQGQPQRKACSVCQLARVLLGQSRQVDEYCHLLNSELARANVYRANEQLVIPRMFFVNYVDKGDSQKISSADDFQYKVLTNGLVKSNWQVKNWRMSCMYSYS